VANLLDTVRSIGRHRRTARWRPEHPALLAAALLLLVVWPLLVRNNYAVDVANNVATYVVLGLGLNIVIGYAGLLDLGYVAFYAVGAYVAAFLITQLGWSLWECMLISAAMAAVFGILLGAPTLRLRGDYLAIVTLGFGEIIRITLNNLTSITGGPNGIQGIPKPSLFGASFNQPIHFYYLLLLLAVVAIFVSGRLANSRVGRAWAYLREDHLAAEVMGVNAVRYKLLAFAMGASWAGLAGAIFSSRIGIATPESFILGESILIVTIVVIGGMGSVYGVVAGAFAMLLLPELFRPLQTYRLLIFGVAMILMMRFRPEGLLPSRRRQRELEEEPEPEVLVRPGPEATEYGG
jgi:branched-chain amino acid transport system permease protein